MICVTGGPEMTGPPVVTENSIGWTRPQYRYIQGLGADRLRGRRKEANRETDK